MTQFKIIEDSPAVKVIREYGKLAVRDFDYTFLAKGLISYSREDDVAIFEDGSDDELSTLFENLGELLSQIFGKKDIFDNISYAGVEKNMIKSTFRMLKAIARYQAEKQRSIYIDGSGLYHTKISLSLSKELWFLIYTFELNR